MDFTNLKSYVNAVAKEKDLDPAIIKEAVEHALVAASKKNLSQFKGAHADLNMETGLLSLLVQKLVVEEVKNDRAEISRREARRVLKDKKIDVGDEIEVPIDPAVFGRIAAQSARQIVVQRIRDAERAKIYEEYSRRVGTVVTGTIQRFERRDVIMNVGRTEGTMPLYEQPMGVHFKHNDRLKVLITDVKETPKGPLIVLSRKSPNLVVRLFEQEVPEIADGTVKIIGVAREAGVRTKIAVTSMSTDVDPVGACVGMKGSRVQMVVRELDNEKIDIVPHSIDPVRFISSALNPAKIRGIHLNEREKRAEVIVARGNLAIAIGRKGQNSKLAARLTGWRLDIRSEEEEGLDYDQIQTRYLEDFLLQITGLSNLAREALLRSQYNGVEKIAHASPQDLLPFTNDNVELSEELIGGAAEYVEALQEMQVERRRRGLAPGFFMPSEFQESLAAAEGEEQADAAGADAAGAEAVASEAAGPETAGEKSADEGHAETDESAKAETEASTSEETDLAASAPESEESETAQAAGDTDPQETSDTESQETTSDVGEDEPKVEA